MMFTQRFAMQGLHMQSCQMRNLAATSRFAFAQSSFMPTHQRFFAHAAGGADTRFAQIADRFIVIKDLSGDKYPELKFSSASESVVLHGHLTVNEMTKELRAKGHIKRQADFFAPDGSRYAGCSQVKDMLQLPYFRLRLDNNVEYHCESTEAFKESISY